jgi:putative ABC transport system substrate-binding protein
MPRKIETALAPVWRESGGGLVVMPDAFTTVLPRAIIALAAQHRFPAIYPYSGEVVDGGLMSYSVDTVDLFRRLHHMSTAFSKEKGRVILPCRLL